MQGATFLRLTIGVGMLLAQHVCGAAGPTTRPEAHLDLATQQRGAKVLVVLQETLEQAYQNDSEWPAALVAQPGGEQLVYHRPAKLPHVDDEQTLRWRELTAAATVVLHEPIDARSNGAWVGYADGHLEFASTPEQLADCMAQTEMANRHPQTPATQPAPTGGELTLRVVDTAGAEIAGAEVGQYMAVQRGGPAQPPLVFAGGFGGPAVMTDDHGLLKLPATKVFDAKFSEEATAPIHVLLRSRQLMADVELTRDDFKPGAEKTIQLLPACRVHGSLTSVGLLPAGKALVQTNVLIYDPGKMSRYVFSCQSSSNAFDMLLPPGDHALCAYGNDSGDAIRFFHIAPGDRDRSFQLDLPPEMLTRLVGRPAPDLQKIKGWENGTAVKLEDLHGKLVLLDFWGYWCGPCVGSMPGLMALHDKWKDKGLVIIAVHDDSIESIAALDKKLAPLSTAEWTRWKGRTLPFLIALDGGGMTRMKYTTRMNRGATTASYGITSFPTTIAIGRDGNVIGEVSVRSPEGIQKIERMLAKR